MKSVLCWLDRASRWNHRRGKYHVALALMAQMTDYLEISE
jgi:hypothetical protein